MLSDDKIIIRGVDNIYDDLQNHRSDANFSTSDVDLVCRFIVL
jgi:hypothetical protein